MVELNVDGSISTVMTSCGHELGEPFSPSGNLALAVSGDVIAIPSGRVVATLPIPEANSYNTFWEDEDDIVLEIDTLLNRSPYPIQLVRCTISTETCERASDVINVKNPSLLLVPLE